MSEIEDRVCDKIQGRSAKGLEKYGVDMTRDDLLPADWLVHLQEELMDASVYTERLLQESSRLSLALRFVEMCYNNDYLWAQIEEALGDTTANELATEVLGLESQDSSFSNTEDF